MNTTVAIDFETTYSDTRDIRKLGSKSYLAHPETDIYMVSMFGEGVEWVGHPKDAPWELLEGREWISHNRSFDQQVWQELRRRGMLLPAPTRWNCTADLSAFLQVKRDLATASKILLDVHLDKGVRNRMKNQTWEGMTPDFQKEALDYALDDSKACWSIWDRYSQYFPERERLLSEHTSLMCDRGVRINVPLVISDLDWLTPALGLVLQHIPWYGELDIKGKEVKPGSPKRLKIECEKLGIPAPLSTDTKDERFGDWAEEHADSAPFVAAIQQWRQITRLKGFAEGCLTRTQDGRLRYGLKYGGACHTMRWSGDLGLSVHNMPKQAYTAMELGSALWPGEFEEGIRARLSAAGVNPEGTCNPRWYFIPPEGSVFLSSDLQAIEPRVLAYLSGQTRLSELLRGGFEIYEAQARSMGLYSGTGKLKDTDPDLRQTVKVLNLGLGYGLSANGLMRSYRRSTGKKLTAMRAEELVNLYRSKNPEVQGLWEDFKKLIWRAQSLDHRIDVVLPSGKTIRYLGVRKDLDAGPVATFERGAPPKKLWHGLLTENCLAEGTPVLTPSGYKAIQKITTADQVWDGEEWVHHEGVLFNGLHNTLICHGVSCTPDHLFMGSKADLWIPAKIAAWRPVGWLSAQFQQNRPGLIVDPRLGVRKVFDLKNAGPRNRFTVLGDKPLIVHNCTQATAREVHADKVLEVEKVMPVVLHVHDELLIECPEDRAKEGIEHILSVMRQSPEWAPDLPVNAGCEIMHRYEKR